MHSLEAARYSKDILARCRKGHPFFSIVPLPISPQGVPFAGNNGYRKNGNLVPKIHKHRKGGKLEFHINSSQIPLFS